MESQFSMKISILCSPPDKIAPLFSCFGILLPAVEYIPSTSLSILLIDNLLLWRYIHLLLLYRSWILPACIYIQQIAGFRYLPDGIFIYSPLSYCWILPVDAYLSLYKDRYTPTSGISITTHSLPFIPKKDNRYDKKQGNIYHTR